MIKLLHKNKKDSDEHLTKIHHHDWGNEHTEEEGSGGTGKNHVVVHK
jgi:hypothetical protein